MTLKQFLDLVSSGYPDEYTKEYYDEQGNFVETGSGDTLAEFIVIEAINAYEEEEYTDTRCNLLTDKLNSALKQIENVIETIMEGDHYMAAMEE